MKRHRVFAISVLLLMVLAVSAACVIPVGKMISEVAPPDQLDVGLGLRPLDIRESATNVSVTYDLGVTFTNTGKKPFAGRNITIYFNQFSPGVSKLSESYKFAVRTIEPNDSQTINKTVFWVLPREELTKSRYGMPVTVMISIPGFDKPRISTIYLGGK